jgi:hypothetical protein
VIVRGTARVRRTTEERNFRSVSRRPKVILGAGAVAVGSAALVITLFATGILYAGPTLSIRNDESRTITLICDGSYRIPPGRTVTMRLDRGTDGHVCRAVGMRAAVEAGELCIYDSDYRNGQRAAVSGLLNSRCP